MAHVAQGEMVVPPVISPETRQRIEQELRAAGLSPDEYKVGEGMSINPITGMPEFGWLKKTFKSIKKVAKKVAPVVGPLANFIPGVGPLMSAAIQAGTTKLAGGSWKDALKAGAFSYGAGKLGEGIGGLKNKPTGDGLFSRIRSGIGSYFNPAEGATGIFGGSIGPSIRGGIGGLFSNLTGGGQQLPEGLEPIMGTDQYGNTVLEGYKDAAGKTYTAAEGMSLMEAANPEKRFNGLFGPDSIADKLFNVDPNKGTGPLSFLTGGNQASGGIAGLFGGGQGGMGGGMGAAALAGLLGKITYDSAKERMGGLAETPAVTMDQLGRYQLSKELGTGGTRGEFGLPAAQKALEFNMGGPVQYFSQGGAAIKELDMRDGGESAGPGTGTSDDIPAMLSDGEFVMTAKATRGAGAFGMNKTKSGIELVKGGKASREKGVENMRELMNIFEAI
jgi:hypothetical protein